MTPHEAFMIGMVWGALSHALPDEGFEVERPPHEAFMIGMVRGALSHALPEGFEVERPTLDGPATLVVRGKKSGTEVLITVTETRTPER